MFVFSVFFVFYFLSLYYLVNVDTSPAESVTLASTTTDILKSNRHGYWRPRLTDVAVEFIWDIDVSVIGRGDCVSMVTPLVGEWVPNDTVHLVSVKHE